MSKILNYINSLQSGVWGEEVKNDINDVKCIRVADFQYDKLTFLEPQTVRNVTDKNKYFVKKGDILIEKSGGGEKTTVGRAVYVDMDAEFVYANFIERLRPIKAEYGKFLTYFLAYLYGCGINTKFIKQNTGIQNIDIHEYLREEIKLPPESEWNKISNYLDNQALAKTLSLKHKILKSIELLDEYKISLISNAVTGRVKT